VRQTIPVTIPRVVSSSSSREHLRHHRAHAHERHLLHGGMVVGEAVPTGQGVPAASFESDRVLRHARRGLVDGPGGEPDIGRGATG
jgi:hypothetical protein